MINSNIKLCDFAGVILLQLL